MRADRSGAGDRHDERCAIDQACLRRRRHQARRAAGELEDVPNFSAALKEGTSDIAARQHDVRVLVMPCQYACEEGHVHQEVGVLNWWRRYPFDRDAFMGVSQRRYGCIGPGAVVADDVH
eukprot:4948703-Prymnesium_polylepis.1